MHKIKLNFLAMLLLALFSGYFSLFSVAARAQDQLSAEQIAAYTEKLGNAQSIQIQIAERVTCIEARERDLGARSDFFEGRIGELRRSEQEIFSESARRREEFDNRERNYRVEQDRFDAVMSELQHYQVQKYLQEQAVRQCKQDFGPLGFMCDASMAIAHLIGAIESVENKIPPAERNVQIAGESLREAQNALEESNRRLDLVQEELNRVREQARQAEDDMSDIRAKLSILRTEFQNHRLLLNDFQNALQEAASVDTADARARTARQVAYISANVDSLITRVADPRNSILPEGWRAECMQQ